MLEFLRKEGNTIKYWVEPIQKVSINDWTILEGYARSWVPIWFTQNLSHRKV